jgi:PAS domain S-box-containing protein
MDNTAQISVSSADDNPSIGSSGAGQQKETNNSHGPLKHRFQKTIVLLMAAISAGVFVSEILIMGLIRNLREMPVILEALLDAGVLVILLFPLLFFLVFRPLVQNIKQREQLQSQLEARVQDRTKELRKTNELLRQEIVHRKEIEKEISTERQRLFSVLDELPAAVHLVDVDYNIRFANRYFRERFGVNSRPCYKILHNKNKPCHVCNAKEVFKTKCPGVYEEFHKDEHLYRVHNYPFTDADGTDLVLQLGIDITDQKEAENALRASESRFRLLVNSISDTVFTLDRSLKINEIYGFFRSDRNRDREFYLGKQISEVFESDTARIHEDAARRVLAGKNTIYEWQSDFPDGRRYMQSSLAPVFDNNGRVESVVGVARDITFRKMLEKQLIETEKLMALAQMSAMISHEFRNSLTSVRMILELLLESQPETNSLNVALGSVQHMEQIVSQLLRFSKPEPISLAPGYLNDVLNTSIELVNGQLTKYKITLIRDLSTELQPVPIDATHLKEAIVNLLLNAVQSIESNKAGKGTRAIRISSRISRLAPGTVRQFSASKIDQTGELDIGETNHDRIFQVAEVKDTGSGIRAEVLSKIFNPFFTTKNSGTGLGLATVKRTVEAHNGFIEVKSKPGKGTRFVIYIPQTETKA